MEIDVLIVFEYASRELESALLLRKKLLEKGMTAKVVQASWSENLSHLLIKPKVIVIPWCYDSYEYDLFCKYNGSLNGGKFKILNLHCEQLTNSDAQELMIPKGIAKNTYHIAWGEYFKNELIKAGVEESYIYITGSPRLDFFRKEYQYICASKQELSKKYKLDKEKKWVLLIGNFSYASFSKQNLEIIKEKGYEDIQLMSKLSEKTYYKVLQWFDYACKSELFSKDIEFIYRPHPSELTTDELDSIQKKYDNFHVIKDKAIRDWIVNSDMAFSWCSTSAVEVYAAGIPIYNWRPYEIPEILKFPLLEHINQIRDENEFCQKIHEYLYDGIVEDCDFKKHVDFYYHKSEKSAVELTIQAIENILEDDSLYAEKKPFLGFAICKAINYYIKILFYKCGILKRIDKFSLIHDAYIDKNIMQQYKDKIERNTNND